MAEIITVSLAANEQKQFRKGGAAFEIIAADFPLNINLYSDLGGQINTLNNIISGFFLSAKFGAFDVKNGAVAQTIQLLCFDQGESGGSRRQPGTVSVIDGERLKVISGNCFCVAIGITGSTGSPIVQLWNPAASGKNFFVQNINLGLSASDVWSIQTNTNMLNTAAPNNPWNLDANAGSTSVALVRTDNVGQALTGQQTYKIGYLIANTDRQIEFKRPILLRPGRGLLVLSAGLATSIRAAIEYEEWPV